MTNQRFFFESIMTNQRICFDDVVPLSCILAEPPINRPYRRRRTSQRQKNTERIKRHVVSFMTVGYFYSLLMYRTINMKNIFIISRCSLTFSVLFWQLSFFRFSNGVDGISFSSGRLTLNRLSYLIQT